MHKKYIVRLNETERQELNEVVKKLKGTSQKVRRAQILLKADADGPAWTDTKIAEAFNCRVQTIEKLRKRLVTEGFELALNGKKRQTPPIEPLLDGRGQAQLLAQLSQLGGEITIFENYIPRSVSLFDKIFSDPVW